MRPTLVLAAAIWLVALPAASAPHLERVVLVMRHGVRAPDQTNADLAKYADKPWPDWPVARGELTPHGRQTVTLMGASVRVAYRGVVLPPAGCPGAGEVSVWADGATERTEQSGVALAEALAPGCGVKAAWIEETPRDPIFGGSTAPACRLDADTVKAEIAAAAAGPDGQAPVGEAVARLQATLAPSACHGGAGACLTPKSPAEDATGAMRGAFPMAAALAENILLEYADGKPMSEVAWGRASAADIAAFMPIHARAFAVVRDERRLSARRAAQMTRVILGALAGEPVSGGPQSGPSLKLMALVGHDTNLVLMASVFGLSWTLLPGEPDVTAPSTVLAFELWRDGGRDYVRPVIFYETLEQLRTLKPDRARERPLSFDGCASGPMGGCPLEELRRRALAATPPDCV